MKDKINYSFAIKSLSFFIICLVLIIFNSNELFAWKLQKKSEGISVFTREVDSSRIKEVKGTTLLTTSINDILVYFKDISTYPLWMEGCYDVSILQEINDFERYTYYKSKAPWPMNDRELVLHSVVKKDDSNNSVIIQINAVPNYISRNKNYTRVEVLKGFWKFKSLGENKVEVTYQIHADPGGYIPQWLINQGVVKRPFQTIKNLKNMVLSSSK